MGGLHTARAQSQADPTLMAQVQSLNQGQAEQARLRAIVDAAPAAYEDNFMSADELTGLRAGEPQEVDPSTLPPGLRSWVLESRLGVAQSDAGDRGRQSGTELGQRLQYRQQTLNYGDWLLQADVRSMQGGQDSFNGIGALGYARQSSSQRITLRNLAMPVTPGIRMDTTIGDGYSELTAGLGQNYRLMLGTTTLRGLSTRISGADFDISAGMGERGDLLGGPYPGFEKSQGTVAWVGATQRLSSDWYAAGQLNQANNIAAVDYGLGNSAGSGSKRVSSWAAALGYGSPTQQDGALRGRLTALGSTTSSDSAQTPSGSAQGLYLEANTHMGRYRHAWGAYVTRPNLHFGDYLLPSGTQGAYWRMDHSSSRLSWGSGLDIERMRASNLATQQGQTRVGINGNVHYQLDRRTAMGGNLNVYQTRYAGDGQGGGLEGKMRSLYAYGFYQTRFGDLPRSRFSLSLRSNEQIVLGDGTATGRELQWEQDWISAQRETMRTELITTLGWADDRSNGTTQHYPTAGVQGRYWASSSLSFSGNLRYTSQSGGLSTSRGLSGNLAAEKQWGHGWSMGLGVLLNQARLATTPVLSLTSPQIYRSNDKTAYVYLRWEGGTGRPFAVAGGMPGNGSGSVSGRVFYDANKDGRIQPDETGAQGIEVVLDGRYRTTTDAEGRFLFPMVGVGRHQLSLTLDSVPLPWGAADGAVLGVDVPLRGEANAEIPITQVEE
ncbi:SdrD B-like domain-containing protein [Comamonas piscis]